MQEPKGNQLQKQKYLCLKLKGVDWETQARQEKIFPNHMFIFRLCLFHMNSETAMPIIWNGLHMVTRKAEIYLKAIFTTAQAQQYVFSGLLTLLIKY